MAYEPNSDEKTMGMLSHLLCLLTGWVGPLILFLVKKDESVYVKLHAKQALVWALAMMILSGISGVLIMVLIGCVLLPAVFVVNIVFTILGAVKTNKGEKFVYPVVANWFCAEEIEAVYGEAAAAAPPSAPPPVAPPQTPSPPSPSGEPPPPGPQS